MPIAFFAYLRRGMTSALREDAAEQCSVRQENMFPLEAAHLRHRQGIRIVMSHPLTARLADFLTRLLESCSGRGRYKLLILIKAYGQVHLVAGDVMASSLCTISNVFARIRAISGRNRAIRRRICPKSERNCAIPRRYRPIFG